MEVSKLAESETETILACMQWVQEDTLPPGLLKPNDEEGTMENLGHYVWGGTSRINKKELILTGTYLIDKEELIFWQALTELKEDFFFFFWVFFGPAA